MRILNSLLLCFCCVLLLAQDNTPLDYSKIKINLENTELIEVARLGLEVDHGILVKNRFLINDFSSEEIELLRQNNITFEVLIEDVVAYYQDQNRHDHEHQQRNPTPCEVNSPSNYTTPANYEYGSMGGYLTYSELLTTLDSMRAKYPNLISEKAPVGNLLTFEGRPIHWLRVSDNPDVDEAEPEILYTALHHAREPNSMAQMVFYLWYLLENYDADPEIKYLVDHTEMYFMPCVNPDGYVYNETTNSSGGGLWRKNRRKDVDSSSYGVDLNRNYGYFWGFDNNGSSPYNSSGVFRGPAPFSEPETQAVKELADAHEFQIALNYHVYGNLLIHPWGYNDEPTIEDITFKAFGNLMTGENDYLVGTASETVGYIVNGSSDDWQYGETVTKPPIYAMTPEVGATGFWPQSSEIDGLNKSVLRQNLVTAHLVLNYAELADESTNFLYTATGALDFNLIKYGLEDGPVTVTFSSTTPGVVVTTAPQTLNMSHLDMQMLELDYQLPTPMPESVVFVAELDNGLYSFTQTFTKEVLGDTETVFSDNADSFDNWQTAGAWALTTNEYYSSPSSLTDSPGRDYFENINNVIQLKETIDLTNAENAVLRFRAKWHNDSNGYDYAQAQISGDGGSYEPQCGRYTELAEFFNSPGYLREQQEWVLEEINLSAYLGQVINLRFAMVSSFGIPEDGIYIDDVEVLVVPTEISAIPITATGITGLNVYPNPAKEKLVLDFELSEFSQGMEVNLYNTLGQIVLSKDLKKRNQGKHQVNLNLSSLDTGCYFLELKTVEGQRARKMVVVGV